MASSAGSRPSGAVGSSSESLGWRPFDPSVLMKGLPTAVSKTLYKVGLRRRCCHLCFSRDHLVCECPNGSLAERKRANDVYYKFWTFIVADELLAFSLSTDEDEYFRRASVKNRTHYIQPSSIMAHGTAIGQRHPGLDVRRAHQQMENRQQSSSSTSDAVAPSVVATSAESSSVQQPNRNIQQASASAGESNVPLQFNVPVSNRAGGRGRDGRGGRGGRSSRGRAIGGSNYSPQPIVDFNTQWRTPARLSKGEKHVRPAAAVSSMQSPSVSPPNKVYKPNAVKIIPREVLQVGLTMEEGSLSPSLPRLQASSQEPNRRIFAYKDLDSWTLDKFKQAGKDAREYYWQNVGPVAALKMAMALRDLPVGHQTRVQAEPHWKPFISRAEEAQKAAPQQMPQSTVGVSSSEYFQGSSSSTSAEQEDATSCGIPQRARSPLPVGLVASAGSLPQSDSPPLVPFDNLDGQDVHMQA